MTNYKNPQSFLFAKPTETKPSYQRYCLHYLTGQVQNGREYVTVGVIEDEKKELFYAGPIETNKDGGGFAPADFSKDLLHKSLQLAHDEAIKILTSLKGV